MKRQNIYKGFLDYWADEFSHHYACWAYNHRGWAKSKLSRRRWAKKRLRRECRKEIDDVLTDCELDQDES